MTNEDSFEKRLCMAENYWEFIFCIANAFYNVDNFKGIDIIMHYNENNHRGEPHCHAKYKNKEIVISLKDFSIKYAKNMDSKHIKYAVEYVKENLDVLRHLWNQNPGVIQF